MESFIFIFQVLLNICTKLKYKKWFLIWPPNPICGNEWSECLSDSKVTNHNDDISGHFEWSNLWRHQPHQWEDRQVLTATSTVQYKPMRDDGKYIVTYTLLAPKLLWFRVNKFNTYMFYICITISIELLVWFLKESFIDNLNLT